MPLAEGETHFFRVRSVGEKILLSVVDKSIREGFFPRDFTAAGRAMRGKLAELLAEILAARDLRTLSEESRQDLETLSRLFPALVYEEPQQGDGKWLSQSLLACGLFWEHKVLQSLIAGKGAQWKTMVGRDLKGLLLSLLESLEKEPAGENQGKGLADKLGQAVTLLEKHQSMNLAAFGEGWGWYWFIPGRESGGLKNAELFGKKFDRRGVYHLYLSIDLTRLGQMDAEVSLKGSSVEIRFLLDDAEKARLSAENLESLEAGLNAVGLRLGQAIFEVRGQEDLPPSFFQAENGPSIDLII